MLQAWKKSRDEVTVSMLHMAIARSMRELGLRVQLEYNEGYFSVDLAMFLPPSTPGGQPRKVRLDQLPERMYNWEECSFLLSLRWLAARWHGVALPHNVLKTAGLHIRSLHHVRQFANVFPDIVYHLTIGPFMSLML